VGINKSYLKELAEKKRQSKPKFQVGTETSENSAPKPFGPEYKMFPHAPKTTLPSDWNLYDNAIDSSGNFSTSPINREELLKKINQPKSIFGTTLTTDPALKNNQLTDLRSNSNLTWDASKNQTQERLFPTPIDRWKNYSFEYNPTLEEFKAVYEQLPRFNQGYESITDSDPYTPGVQSGSLSAERLLELKAIPEESQLRNMYFGKTFGGLPLVEKPGFYEGYNPHRIWTSFANNESQPFIGYDASNDRLGQPSKKTTIENLETNPLYTYYLLPKDSNPENTPIAGPQPFGLGYRKEYQPYTPDFNYAPLFWNNSESMQEELLANPEIAEYLKEKGINLQKEKKIKLRPMTEEEVALERNNKLNKRYFSFENKGYVAENPEDEGVGKYMIPADKGEDGNIYGTILSETGFGYPLAEALLARRDAIINKRDAAFSQSGRGYPIIQNPEAFTLAGYLPVTKDMYYTDAGGNVESYWDNPKKRKEYLRKAGVPEDQLDKVFIHTSKFPLQEYKPRKDAKGNIYKEGGVSTEGYKRNSPDVNNPYNIIPSNQITMNDVDFPVLGIDDLGNQIMMQPGEDYTFPGSYVTEFPMKNMGNKRFGQVGMEKSNQTRSFMNIIPNFIPGVNDILDFSDIIQGIYKGDKNQMNQGIIGLAAPGIAGKGMGEMVDYFTEKTLGKKTADKNQSKRNDILNMSSSDLQKLYTKYGPGGYDKWKAAGFPKLKEGGVIRQSRSQVNQVLKYSKQKPNKI
jgi:hypothetical protein